MKKTQGDQATATARTNPAIATARTTKVDFKS